MKAEMPTLVENKRLSIHFFPHRARSLIFLRKMKGLNPLGMEIKVLIPAETFDVQ